jgi:hypothetical protein
MTEIDAALASRPALIVDRQPPSRYVREPDASRFRSLELWR